MQAGPSQSKDIYVIVFVGYTTKLTDLKTLLALGFGGVLLLALV